MDQGPERRVDEHTGQQGRGTQQRCLRQPCSPDTGNETDIGTDPQVQIVNGDHAHLGNGRKGDGQRQIQEQFQAGVTHGPRLEVEDRQQQNRQRESREKAAEHSRPADRSSSFWSRLAKERLGMVDLTEQEQAAIRAGRRMVAESMEEIGWDTRLIDLSEAQVLTLIEVAVGGFQTAMFAMAKNDDTEIPF